MIYIVNLNTGVMDHIQTWFNIYKAVTQKEPAHVVPYSWNILTHFGWHTLPKDIHQAMTQYLNTVNYWDILQPYPHVQNTVNRLNATVKVCFFGVYPKSVHKKIIAWLHLHGIQYDNLVLVERKEELEVIYKRLDEHFFIDGDIQHTHGHAIVYGQPWTLWEEYYNKISTSSALEVVESQSDNEIDKLNAELISSTEAKISS